MRRARRTTQAERNEALVRRLIEIVNAGELGALEEVMDGPLAEQARSWIGPFRAAFPDFRMEVREVVTEGEEVVGHVKCSGTQRGEWRGTPPSGQRFESVDEIYAFRVEGWKLAAALAAHEDNPTRMRQLGLDQDGSEPEWNTIWGHSLAGAAVCVGTGAALALISIFGPPW